MIVLAPARIPHKIITNRSVRRYVWLSCIRGSSTFLKREEQVKVDPLDGALQDNLNLTHRSIELQLQNLI